ncbi:hypothetical protein [Serratia sp. X3]|uniref:hypothetical protein n=1 Tax=Serratia sp. X3 TaxID=2780495 RepID=UPI001D0BEF20|nr:hypothetical protein [Serratia sp. X3]
MNLHLLASSLAIVCILQAPGVHASVYGGSNLSYSGYPEFNDFPPSAPYGNDQYAWDNYKQEVEDYVRKAKEYISYADNDMERINEGKQAAIRKANNAVEEYNRSVKGY